MLPGELSGAGDRVEYAWLGARGASPSVKLLNGTPVAWNPVSGVDREVGLIWRQPTPPPSGVHYAWLGEPHGSVSVRLDGDGNETARNYFRNSRFSGGTAEWGNWSGASIDVNDDGNLVVTYPGNPQTNSGATQSVQIGAGDEGTYTMTAKVRRSSEDIVTRFQINTHNFTHNQALPLQPPVGEWGIISYTFNITNLREGNNSVYIFGNVAGAEGTLEIEWAMLEKRDTFDGYFDGDTVSDRANDLWYNADGVPHEWVNGHGWVEADSRFTPVPDHHQTLRIDTSLHGDIPDVIPGPNSPARDLRSIVIIDGVQREHDGWDVVRELNGDLPAQVVSSSGLMQATGRITFSDETVRNNARNPFNRGTGWIPRRGQEVRIYVEHRGQWFQRFQGVIDKVNGAVGGGLQATIIDGHDRFSAEVNHEPLLRIMPPLTEGERRRGVGLTAYYYIDYVARAAGYYCTPPRERNTSLAMHGQTSLWPQAGTLQSTSPLDGNTHARNKPAGGWMALGQFSALYTPWGEHTSDEPLQITMMVASFHTGIAYVNVPFASGSRTVRLTVNSNRTATLTVGGATVASLALGQATVVSALIKGPIATLRTNTGATATGSTTISGGRLDDIRVYADSLAAIAGIQVSHPASSNDELDSTYWRPTAHLDTGSIALSEAIEAGPRLDAKRAGNVLNEITDAILSAAWIDETGILQVIPSNVLRDRSPVRTVTTLDDVLSLDWEDTVLQVPSRVTVTTDTPAITNSIYRNVVVWEGSKKELTEGEDHVEFVEPSGNEDWIMVQSDIAKSGPFSSASWDYVNGNRRTVGGGYYAVDGDLISTQPEGFTVEMETLGISRYLIRTSVQSAPAGSVLVTAAPPDHPDVWDTREGDALPRVNAFGKVERTTERVSAVTVSGPGPELEHDTGPWVMYPETSGEIANYIAGQTVSPQPVIRRLEIFPDPRLQLGDMIRLSSDTLLGVRITALIVGLSEGMDRDGGMTQILTVRISSVTTTADTYLGWEDALTSGQVTYSAFNNLPPSPQDYQDFNLFY